MARCRPGDTLLAASVQGPSRRQSRDKTGDNADHLGKNPLMNQEMRRQYQTHFHKLITNQDQKARLELKQHPQHSGKAYGRLHMRLIRSFKAYQCLRTLMQGSSQSFVDSFLFPNRIQTNDEHGYDHLWQARGVAAGLGLQHPTCTENTKRCHKFS